MIFIKNMSNNTNTPSADTNVYNNNVSTTTAADTTTNYYLGTFTLILSSLTILGNLVTLLVIKRSRSRSLRRPHITLICFLSLTDLLIGTLHMLFVGIACFTGIWIGMDPATAEQPFPKQFLNQGIHMIWCRVSAFFYKPLFQLTLATVTLIGMERIITIRFPLNCERWVTNTRCVMAYLAGVVVVLGLNTQDVIYPHTTVFMNPAFQCMLSYVHIPDINRILITSISFNFVSFLTIIIASVYTTVTVMRLKRKARTQMGDESSQTKLVVTVTLLILMCLDTSTWLPQYVLSCIRHMLPTLVSTSLSFLTNFNLRMTVWWLQYLSPALNPLVYAFRLKAIRKEIKWTSAKAVGRMKKNSVSAVRMPMLSRGSNNRANGGGGGHTEMTRCDVTVNEAL
eukprot:sb/3465428/